MLLCEHIERYVMGGPSVCAVEDSRSLLPNQYFLARFTHQMRVKKNERFVVKQKKKTVPLLSNTPPTAVATSCYIASPPTAHSLGPRH